MLGRWVGTCMGGWVQAQTCVATPITGNVQPSLKSERTCPLHWTANAAVLSKRGLQHQVEAALLFMFFFAGKPRAATVVAQSNGILWRLSRGDFRAAVQSSRADPSLLLLRCLKSCELLEPLTNGQLMVMADMMELVRFVWLRY